MDKRDQGAGLSRRGLALLVGLLLLGVLPALWDSNLAAQDKKQNPLEELGKKLKEQIEATAPPTWKARTDAAGDPLPAGAISRLGTARFRHSSSITCVAYSPDGKQVAVGGSDNKARIFDAASGKEVHLLAGHQGSTFVLPARPQLSDFGAPTGKAGHVTAIAYAPDGKLIATGGWDDAVRLWDPATGKQVRSIAAHASLVSAVAFGKDGKILATRGGLDGLVRLWDPVTGKELRTIENVSRRSSALTFSPDGKTLAIGDAKAVSLVDPETGKETKSIAHAGTTCLTFSSDGKTLATGGRDSTIRLWDVATGNEVRRCEPPKKEPPSQLAFSPDGKHLAAAVRENSALIFDTTTGMIAHNFKAFYWPDAVAFAPDGKAVSFGGEPSALRQFEMKSGNELGQQHSGHLSPVTHVAVSANGRWIATGGDGAWIWTAFNGEFLRALPVPGHYVEALALSPDGKHAATGGRDKMVRVWEIETGKETLSYKHEGTLRAVTFSPDGKLLASGDLQLNIRVRDLEADKELQKIKIDATFTDRLSLAFSPDSKTLALGGALNADWPRGIPSTDPYGLVPVLDKGYPIQLYEARTGKELGRLDGLLARVRSVAYSPDGKTLAASSADGRIVLWDLETKKERLGFLAHPDNIDSIFRSSPGITFAPDGKSLASASTDQTLRLWDTVTGTERGRLATGSRTNALTFVREGKNIVTGQADTSALLWDVEFLSTARPLASRNFSIGHIDQR
jgi:WD40 repeat protein